jgi:hypothetical protein
LQLYKKLLYKNDHINFVRIKTDRIKKLLIPPENSRKTCSPGNSAPGGNPGLKRTRVGAIFKKFSMKTVLKSKRNSQESFRLRINTMKLSAASAGNLWRVE